MARTAEEKKQACREASKRWRARNPDKVKESNLKATQKYGYKENHAKRMRELRLKNPERCREIVNNCRNKNKDTYNEKRRIKYQKDEAFRLKRREVDRKYRESGRRKEAHLKNPNRGEVLKRNWQKVKDSPKRIEYNKKYREQVLIERKKKERDELTDAYVVKVIKKRLKYKLKTSEIPKELIELKRNQIKIKRLTKTTKQ